MFTFPFSPTQPGGYSAVDSSGLTASEQRPNAPVGAVVGDCKGGKPNAPIEILNAAELPGTLRSGAALDAARAMFAGGASKVIAVRAGSGITPATSALAGAAGNPVTLTTKEYGAVANGVRRLVEANNKTTITFTDPATGLKTTEIFEPGAAATAQNVVDQINGKVPGVRGSTLFTAAVTAGTMPLTAAADVPAGGGTDAGALVAGDWTTAFTVLETQNVSMVAVATGDATVHAQLAAHLNALSAPAARAERTAVVGGVLGETDAQAAARMAALPHARVQLVYPGVEMLDAKGEIVLYPPYVAAAYTAGQHLALPDEATALTHKRLNGAIIGIERRLSTIPGGELDRLLRANVTPIAPAPNSGFWYVDSLSGYNLDEGLRDFHKTRTADRVARTAREGLEAEFVGGKGLVGAAGDIALKATQILEDLRLAQIIKAYRPVGVSQPNARTYAVNLPVLLPDTTKFILIAVSLQANSPVASGGPAPDDALA